MKQVDAQQKETGTFDPAVMRQEFAFLQRGVAWLDNAATTQRPETVLAAMDEFSRFHNANVRRSVHRLGAEASAAYEQVRRDVAAFLRAPSPDQVVLTSGATAAINLVVSGLARKQLAPGDAVWVSAMEHHSNGVPWAAAATAAGAELCIIPLTAGRRLDEHAFRQGLRRGNAKWVALSWVSNVLGGMNDIRTLTALAHAAGARVMVDGAQGVAHAPVELSEWDCDFFAFSGHKMFAPMGTGALWGRPELLAEMEPVMLGGEMVTRVDEQGATWADVPYRFEGGTPNAAGAIGLRAAIRWLEALPSAAHKHVRELVRMAQEGLAAIPGVRIWSHPDALSLVTFSLDGIHAHDVAQILDDHAVAVRAGHMCAQPVLRRLGVEAVVRASFASYNTRADVEALLAGVRAAREFFV
ncbi:MAG: cysteine desulfurase [Verrucomicrobiota bacterium]|jgi:cysteine desulfurase/selenocysteine lyase|nr:cysteine desulfurase [Verrucomicrobiota bacterium]